MWTHENAFLNGPHEPQHRETHVDDLVVHGAIPKELSGTLYRIVSSPLFEPLDLQQYHWFDGDGMVVALDLRDGRASFRNRYVETPGLAAERAAGEPLYGSSINGGPPNRAVPPAPPIKNPVNTNVTVFGDRLLAFAEIDRPMELRRDSLETIGFYDFGGIQGAVTAHFRTDPRTGDLLFYGVDPGKLTWYRANPAGRLVEQFSFPVDGLAMVHDFSVTDDYAIFFINPLFFDFEARQQGRPGLVWDPEIPCRIAVLRRADGSVRWIEAPENFANTHFLNAWQDGDKLVVDGCRAVSMGTFKTQPTLRPGLWHEPAFPWRWRLDVAKGTYTHEQTSEFNSEFPRLNDARLGLKARYAYLGAVEGQTYLDKWFFDAAMKQDLEKGTAQFQRPGHSLTAPGESLFVARAGATDEDDGWVLGLWWNQQRNASELVIVNGQDFAGEPQARIELPFRVPLGFHGNWIAD